MDPIPTMKAQQLVQQLKAAAKPIVEGFFVVAGYDPVRRADAQPSVPLPSLLPALIKGSSSAICSTST